MTPIATSSTVKTRNGRSSSPRSSRATWSALLSAAAGAPLGVPCAAAYSRVEVPLHRPLLLSAIAQYRFMTPRSASTHMTQVHGDKNSTDFLLAPAAHLKMVVDRRHFEDPLAVGQLEIGHLDNDRTASPECRRCRPRISTSGISRAKASAADRAAEKQGAGVAHKDLGRMEVVAEEARQAARDGGRKQGQRRASRNWCPTYTEVAAKKTMTGMRHAGGEAVDAVRQVDCVDAADDDAGTAKTR